MATSSHFLKNSMKKILLPLLIGSLLFSSTGCASTSEQIGKNVETSLMELGEAYDNTVGKYNEAKDWINTKADQIEEATTKVQEATESVNEAVSSLKELSDLDLELEEKSTETPEDTTEESIEEAPSEE